MASMAITIKITGILMRLLMPYKCKVSGIPPRKALTLINIKQIIINLKAEYGTIALVHKSKPHD